jgi:hypothetical protein
MSTTSKFRFEVAKLQLAPGDLLVVRFPDGEPMSDPQIQKAMNSLKGLLPAGVGVAWFRGNVSIGVISPTESVERVRAVVRRLGETFDDFEEDEGN